MHKSRPISLGESREYEILHHGSLSVYVLECVCVRAKLLQSYLTLFDVMDCSLPDSSVHRILQAGILEWVAMPSFGDLPNPGIKLESLMSPALAGEFFTASTTWEVLEVFKVQKLTEMKNVTLHPKPNESHTLGVGLTFNYTSGDSDAH